MNEGRTVFAQLLDYLPKYEFDKCVARYRGNRRVRNPGDQGFVRSVRIGQTDYRIRQSQYLPDEFTVITPKAARRFADAKRLADYLSGVLAARRLRFFGEQSGDHGEENLQTLVFLMSGSPAATNNAEGSVNSVEGPVFVDWRLIPT